MAQKTQIILIDDVDGGEAAETVRFGLDGVTYEIDLNAENAARLRDALAPWVGSGRRVSGRGARTSTRRSPSVSGSSADDSSAIRRWARETGQQVSERGRVSASVRAAYAAAH